jgi:hypothetical protein
MFSITSPNEALEEYHFESFEKFNKDIFDADLSVDSVVMGVFPSCTHGFMVDTLARARDIVTHADVRPNQNVK